MTYHVEMQQTGFFHFKRTITDEDANAIRTAKLNQEFKLSEGFGLLDKSGDVQLALRSPGGTQTYALNHAALCRSFKQQDDFPQQDDNEY